MKSVGTLVNVICGLAAAGLAIGVAVERQAGAKLDQENRALRQQLGPMDGIVTANQRLSNLVARPAPALSRPNERSAPPPATDERAQELVRLRAEVAALRQQTREIETLRADTRQARAARERHLRSPGAGPAATAGGPVLVNGSPFEIVRAEYWTEHTNVDVAAELRERVGTDGLKALASNSLKGDPDFGHVKYLTVVYRFGDATRTNEFREGELVVLPAQ